MERVKASNILLKYISIFSTCLEASFLHFALFCNTSFNKIMYLWESGEDKGCKFNTAHSWMKNTGKEFLKDCRTGV